MDEYNFTLALLLPFRIVKLAVKPSDDLQEVGFVIGGDEAESDKEIQENWV